ncbi:MAG: hypothetical protein RQ862_03385 [Candidatus Caldarchaeales archaeon]|jgi:hypothetical protein|nr:hypothetical protein [Candidatus Caldarchaeales archaeon]
MPTNKAAIVRTLNLIVKEIERTGLVKEAFYQIEQPQPLPSIGPHWAVKVGGKVDGGSISAVLFIFAEGSYLFGNCLHTGPDEVAFKPRNAGALARLITVYLLTKYFSAPLEKDFDVHFFLSYYNNDGFAACRLSATKNYRQPKTHGCHRIDLEARLVEGLKEPVFDLRWFSEKEFEESGRIHGDFGAIVKAFQGLILQMFL